MVGVQWHFQHKMAISCHAKIKFVKDIISDRNLNNVVIVKMSESSKVVTR